MKFLAVKTEDGAIRGKISFYCRILKVGRQGFYQYLANQDLPWKYQALADAMWVIHDEDEYNDTYGRARMHQALLLKQSEGVHIPSERTVYRVMEEIGFSYRPKRKPNGITKADRDARKSDDLLKRDFSAGKPLEKCVTDITEIKAKDGKLYVSAIFDYFDSCVLGLAMGTDMKASLCVCILESAMVAYPNLKGAVLHSDRGSQYTSQAYRSAIAKYEHGVNTRQVFSVLRKAVMGQRRWDVLESAYLGIFSFSQFVMWNDIRNRSDELAKNKVIRSLMEGRL